jgi:hypothetical protein
MTDQHEKIYVTIPTFNGDKEQWRTFKAKMQSYLARNQMGALLRWTQDIPDNTEDLTDQSNPVKKAKLQIRELNEKATAILLGSIETRDKAGMVAFSMVKKTMKTDYASGDIKKAWKSMNTKYEDTDTVSKADLKKEYYALMMEEDELPSYFIRTMEEMRIVLEEIGKCSKTDDEFMLDILSKLPEGKEGELGPYQVERKLIEPKINDPNEIYTIENLSRDLDRLHNSLYKKEGKVEPKKAPERESNLKQHTNPSWRDTSKVDAENAVYLDTRL